MIVFITNDFYVVVFDLIDNQIKNPSLCKSVRDLTVVTKLTGLTLSFEKKTLFIKSNETLELFGDN